MCEFAWRRRPTRHFGEQWVPFAEVDLRSAAGRWRAFSVQVDTGAVISVVSRSVADLLGIDIDQGALIDLAGVGGPPKPCHVHRIQARIGDLPEFEMRVAVAHQENVPNLLGRLDVLDRFQIDLDASLERTRISPPWLDGETRQIWRACLEVEACVIQAWSDHPLPGRVDEAAKRFVNRADQLVAAGAGLQKLHRDFELPLMIRSLFELSVQFEYLMRDPGPRAALYLEYEHVTRHRIMQAWLRLPGPAGERLRTSPRRVDGEERERAEYDRVCGQYARTGKPDQVRMHWYPGNLRRLAAVLGRAEEYDAVYSLYSAWAHGDPWASSILSVPHSGIWQVYAYWSRILILIADAKQIILAGESYELLSALAQGPTRS